MSRLEVERKNPRAMARRMTRVVRQRVLPTFAHLLPVEGNAMLAEDDKVAEEVSHLLQDPSQLVRPLKAGAKTMSKRAWGCSPDHGAQLRLLGVAKSVVNREEWAVIGVKQSRATLGGIDEELLTGEVEKLYGEGASLFVAQHHRRRVLPRPGESAVTRKASSADRVVENLYWVGVVGLILCARRDLCLWIAGKGVSGALGALVERRVGCEPVVDIEWASQKVVEPVCLAEP